MSIPPLVCSTPPPPEQCEDDKDPEDFDLHYNLSQDDEEDYEYSQFSKPNEFHLPVSKYTNTIDDEQNDISLNRDSNDKTEDCILHTTIEESINIEDLNLEINDEYIEKNEDSDTSLNDILSNDQKTESHNSEIPNENIPNVCNIESLCSEIKMAPYDTSQSDKSEEVAETPQESSTKLENIDARHIINNNSKFGEDISSYNASLDDNEKTESEYQDFEEDFDDFDSFQNKSTNNKKVDTDIKIDTENPWGSSSSDNNAFNEFKADFGNDYLSKNPMSFPQELSSKIDESETKPAINSPNEEIDDEFGDFDEFKYSVTEDNGVSNLQDAISEQPVPVFNLHSDNEHQLTESINKILQSIFIEEITAPVAEIKSNLESFLGETWAHLKDTDIRRPYMVNWNNSLAQETLLKALCIDSRNILYGPKWNNNMPKYAANMSTGPLMPLKQTIQTSSVQGDQVVVEKLNKSSWQDPFTSDGQESCAVEKQNAEMESGPTDIDVFEAAILPKTDKIYSSTLNIQPIRQINLPDTHIFTPTDSETPRSKTIHYDNNIQHSALIPQPVAVLKTQEDDLSSGKIIHKSSENENDYWEFQDYKGSANMNISPKHQNVNGDIKDSPIIEEDNSKSKIYKSQVLQPIKLEPIMPTLNWPNPGEVKETFDDFADFISNVPCNDRQIPSSQHDDVLKQIKNHDKIHNVITSENIDQIEDDFKTFQSALPLTMNVLETNVIKPRDTPLTQNMVDYDNFFSKIDTVKSENIFINKTKPTENETEGIEIPDTKEPNFISAPLTTSAITGSNILQPTHITPHSLQHTEQRTGQILQPLSLESYSQINWPNPGIDLHDLSRFNPLESLSSLKSELGSHSKNSSPSHSKNPPYTQAPDDDIWGEYKSSITKPQQSTDNKQTSFVDDDEWTDFISSPSVPQNGLNTISYNVHANVNIQMSSNTSKNLIKSNDPIVPIDIPTLNYITPKKGNQKDYNERHFQNL